MKIVIVGKGLAGLGALEALIQSKQIFDISEVSWVAPETSNGLPSSSLTCSLNTTALVCLQGIQKGISPLGDLLYDSYFASKEFFETHLPTGVEKAKRFHVVKFGDIEGKEKLQSRFGPLSEVTIKNEFFLGIEEEVYLIEPAKFLLWWKDKILNSLREKEIKLNRVDDLALDFNSQLKRVFCQDVTLEYDKLILATGAIGLDLPLGGNLSKGKKVVGHFYKKQISEKDFPFDCSTVLTVNGHNLIFNQLESTIILGGTNEGEGPLAPKQKKISDQRNHFLDFFPSLKDQLQFKKEDLFTGVRFKAPKRMPFAREVDENVFEINGFYKNGWSLCHYLPKTIIN